MVEDLTFRRPFNTFSSVQSLSHVRLFATPWIAAHQASLSITNSRSLPKFISTESVMPSSHLILCRPLCRHPRRTGHGGEFWQNKVYWRRERQTTLAFLPWEPHENHEKAKREDTERWTPQVGRCPICYWITVEKYLQKEWRDRAKAKTTRSCECD